MKQTARLNAQPGSAEELAGKIFAPANRDRTEDMLAAIRALGSRPASFDALVILARWSMTKRASALAAELFEKALKLKPNDVDALAMYGAALHESGRQNEALAAMRQAMALAPGNLRVRGNYGALLYKMGKLDEAVEQMSVVVAKNPSDPNAKLNLAEAFAFKQRYDDAFVLAQSALEVPEFRERAFLVLYTIFFAQCDLDRAIYYLRQAIDCTDAADSVTPYLFYLQASAAHSDEQVFEEHVRLGVRLEAPGALSKRHSNVKVPERRLKVGFVSGDYFNHASAHFMLPLFRYMDRDKFEVCAIPTNVKFDAVTEMLRELSDHWLPIGDLADPDAAALIEAQGIDVLLDLSGHTAGNRLLVFGRKPAPVQATWLGYPGTTGMRTMDYRITTELYDPTGVAEQQYVEKLIRLPGAAAAFQPHGDVEINDLPCLSGAPFTFACLNQTWRINPMTVACWARIMEGVHGSRFLFGNIDSPHIALRLINMFAKEGISQERLLFAKRMKQEPYLQLHHQIDLCLDTYPYNGGTTTTYALWMGVPVVSLEGGRTAARTGRTVLGQAGLGEFVAKTPEAYIACALDWARRPDDLQAMRQSMRSRHKVSQEGEQVKLANEFGDALRTMWRNWCAS